ncbi:interleukin-34 isoform X1 [Dendrobates tinctorius]|uniref:interleukin-34 isoform X1 n=1 Tax=Dendrobates tinctorius TaxID=92724 RepID=UPI003CCA5235
MCLEEILRSSVIEMTITLIIPVTPPMKGALTFLLCVVSITLRTMAQGRVIDLSVFSLQRDYFPTDYQLPVKYEEILRCQNISSLVSKGLSVDELRFLWGIVSENVLLSIWHVLPQRHPSHSYINDLKTIFHELHAGNQPDLTDIAKDLVGRLWTPGDKVKGVAPKDLLDDCWRVLDVLYQEECGLCLPRSAPQDALCHIGSVPGPWSAPRPSC